MTLKDAYDYGQKQLEEAGIQEFALDAWYLLEYVTGITRASYFMKVTEEIAEDELQTYQRCLKKRKMHIPVQHITGIQEFMGLKFYVNQHVLVPRQDTEILVETVLPILNSQTKVLDMCTGSGCILISLMKLGKIAVGTGVDISEKALEVAHKNAELHGVNPVFIESNLFQHVEGKYDVIVSNPPYIKTSVIQELDEEVKRFDPFIALDGKEDGLFFYRNIIKESPRYLNEHGKIYFEIGHDQGEDVKKLMEEAGFKDVTVKKDLAGLDRVVFGVYNISEGVTLS